MEKVSERGELVDDKGDEIKKLQKRVKELEVENISLKEQVKHAPNPPERDIL